MRTIFRLIYLINVFAFADVCDSNYNIECLSKVVDVSSYESMALKGEPDSVSLMCGKYLESLLCMNKFSRECLGVLERRTMIYMLAGPKNFISQVCRHGEYQKRYFKLGNCLRKTNAAVLGLCSDEVKVKINMAVTGMLLSSEYQRNVEICRGIRKFVVCIEMFNLTGSHCNEEDDLFLRKLVNDLVGPFQRYTCGENDLTSAAKLNVGFSKENNRNLISEMLFTFVFSFIVNLYIIQIL
ncbi:Uncharacterised protein g674 [Pycnogonum litorale]